MFRHYRFAVPAYRVAASARSRLLCTSPQETNIAQPTETQPFLDSLYSEDERKLLLEVFNVWTSQELMSLRSFSKTRVQSLENYRTTSGPILTLATILRVTGIGVLQFEKTCNTVLKMKETNTNPRKHQKLLSPIAFCQPELSQKKCQNMQHVVAVEFYPDMMYWAQMSATSQLLDWNSRPVCSLQTLARLDYAMYMEDVSKALSFLPKSTVYITEKKMLKPTYSRDVRNKNPTMYIVEAMATAMLNSSFSEDKQHCVYSVDPRKVAKFFALTVGSERISGQHVTQTLLGASEHAGVTVNVPTYLKEYYLCQEDGCKEHLSNCLLQAAAFLKIMLKIG